MTVTHNRETESISRDDRILPLTRWTALVVVLVLLTAFILLYLFPARTEELFAWTIRPPITPMLMGAGYAAGAYFFVRAFLSRRWHEVALAFPAITVFCWFMAAATLLHWDRFNHQHPSMWLWASVYALTPFVLPVIWLINRRTDPGPSPGDVLIPRFARTGMGALGVVNLLVSLWLFFLPESAIPIWPWALTPLTARVLAGWFALPGAGSLLMAFEPRWGAWKIILEGVVLYAGLLLIGIVRGWADFDLSKPLAWVYLLLIGGSMLASIGLLIGMGRLLNRHPAAVSQITG